MTRTQWIGRLGSAGLLLGGCQGLVTVVQPVDITGTVETEDGDLGPIQIQAYQAWAGDGVLRYPMRQIDQIWVDGPGDYALSVELPVKEGEGLVLVGWQDVDGDGTHCAPGGAQELTGSHPVSEGKVPPQVEADLFLDIACVGPTRLFP